MNIKEELAACYKISDYYGLSDLTFGHISFRVDNGFYIKDPMMSFKSVTADNLKFIEIESTTKSFSDFGVHNKIYKNIAECSAIMHVHTDAICAIAASSDSILNISQPASLVNTSFADYEYESNLLFDGDYSSLINLCKEYQFILMRNHGFITTGKTLQQVFFNTYMFDKACRIQLMSRNPKELSGELLERKRELALLLKFHQTRKDLWKNLITEFL
jgi:ribulose-5-phosphate 4-epimerase/fuculose-1-phosphate aldolase